MNVGPEQQPIPKGVVPRFGIPDDVGGLKDLLHVGACHSAETFVGLHERRSEAGLSLAHEHIKGATDFLIRRRILVGGRHRTRWIPNYLQQRRQFRLTKFPHALSELLKDASYGITSHPTARAVEPPNVEDIPLARCVRFRLRSDAANAHES